ncbi:MFS transporter [Pedobacter sp. 22163]|uniref:MFS transporter n=1 Tax=Pedobacter sp. 22163 TaxID=3453883 RepID=UPI003F86CFC9
MAGQDTFRPGISPWGIRVCIFMLLIPNLLLFCISTANIAAASGFYGIDSDDAQFSLIILYAGVVSFFPLERHLSGFLSTRNYLVISVILEITTAYAAYLTRDFTVLIVIRFLQGLANISLVAICINLIFSSLRTERSREIGYSVLYCILLCISPITILLTAPLIDQIDYNKLYLYTAIAFVPGGLFAFYILNERRLNESIPIHGVDWKSFIIYSTALVSLSYTLTYGQQLDWFESSKILLALFLFFISVLAHFLRQSHLERAFLSTAVFRYTNFWIGTLLLLVLYISRGAFNFTTAYFVQSLGFSPAHLGFFLIYNIIGAIAGTVITSRLMIAKVSFRMIWISGLSFLLMHQIWMIFLFNSQGEEQAFIIPLFLQGFGAGLMLAPIIVYMVTSVPLELGGAAVSTAISVRLLGTLLSMGLINYFQLSASQLHIDRFQQNLSADGGMLEQRLSQYRQVLARKYSDPHDLELSANQLLKNVIDHQAAIRTEIDYYVLISILLAMVILIIAVGPSVKYKKVPLDGIHDVPV